MHRGLGVSPIPVIWARRDVDEVSRPVAGNASLEDVARRGGCCTPEAFLHVRASRMPSRKSTSLPFASVGNRALGLPTQEPSTVIILDPAP